MTPDPPRKESSEVEGKIPDPSRKQIAKTKE